MNSRTSLKVISFIFMIFMLGCSNPLNLPTPEKIGDKDRTRIISGKQAAQVVNKLHGRSVATDANLIVEYGKEKTDFLYISYYADQKESKKAFNLMLEKMTTSQKGPFFHLMPLSRYQNKVYMTLGMGAIHYIYVSGNFLLWLQSFQSFGDELPQQLLELYPV